MKNTDTLHIVFLHGWGMNKGIWTSFIELCELKRWNNISFEALDLPGCGESIDDKIQRYTIDTVANIVGEQLRPNTLLVGWSMGGLIAQHLVDSGNKNVLAHVQIASTPKFVQTNNWEGIKLGVLCTFSEQLKIDHTALLKRFLAIQCLGLDKPKQQRKKMYDAICKYPLSHATSLDKSLTLLIDTDLRPAAVPNTVSTVPCLRIFGSLDTLVPPQGIVGIQALYPLDAALVIEKASHAPFLSHPQDTLLAIEAFTKPFLDSLEIEAGQSSEAGQSRMKGVR